MSVSMVDIWNFVGLDDVAKIVEKRLKLIKFMDRLIDSGVGGLYGNLFVATSLFVRNYKKLSYRRGTSRCAVSVEILPIAT